MRNFIGRSNYLKLFDKIWSRGKTQLVALYGRRRVGKSEFIRQFAKNKDALIFEALENEDTKVQISHFLKQLSDITHESHLADLRYQDWPPVFDLLTEKLKQRKKIILAFDELSWMAAGRNKLISYLKYYWDKHWKYHPHLVFILCGSVASWMVKHVIHSKALYGRISQTVLLHPLEPHEVTEFIGNKRGKKETMEYLLCFGGIPRYLQEFDFNVSLQLNVEETCFQSSGFFVEEAEKIFYNQFKETHIYQQIVTHLMRGPLQLKDISKKINMPSSGGVKQYLENLNKAQITDIIPCFKKLKPGKIKYYRMTDEFLNFHATFIAPHREEIQNSRGKNKFAKFTTNTWESFLGRAFERFCLKNRYLIADLLGFLDKVTASGSVNNNQKNGYQYDLIYFRSDDTLTLCEVKYQTEPPGTKLIKEFEEKIRKTKFQKYVSIEKILICNKPATQSLIESHYFHRILSAEEIISNP